MERAAAVRENFNENARAELDAATRLQSAIAESIAAAVAIVRASDGEIVYTNDACDRMFGFDRGELIGRHISTITAPGDQSPETRALEIMRALERDGVWRGEIRDVRKDKTRFWSAASISTFDHPEHGATWLVVQTDISPQKAAEESHRIVEERFRRVFEDAPIGIAIVGHDQRLIDANGVLSEVTGFSCDELLGKTLADITHPDDVELDRELSDKAFSGELDRYRINKRFVTKESDVIPIAMTATSVRDLAGRPLHAIVIIELLGGREPA